MIAEFHCASCIEDIAVQKDPFIAVAAFGKEIVILDLKEMRVRSKCIGHTKAVKKVGISADGKRVLSWSEDCTVRQWNIQFGKEDTDKSVRLDHHDDDVVSVAFCTDKNFMITGSRQGMVKVWDLCSGESLGCVMDSAGYVRCMRLSQNGRIIALGVDGEAVLLWDMETFTALGGELRGHLNKISSVAFSPDGRFLVSAGGSGDDTICLRDVQTREQIGDRFGSCKKFNFAHSITFSEDGQQIVSGHFGGLIVVWDVASGAARCSWDSHYEWVVCVSATSDGGSQCVVSGGREGVVRLWDLEAAANVGNELTQHDEPIECVATSPDGRLIVSASMDKTLRLWNGDDGTALGGALCGHENIVSCVAVSPDNCQVVSGSQDCTLRVWEVATGAQVGDALRGHEKWVLCVAYSGDGRFVVSGSGDHTARVWRVIDNPPVGEGVSEPMRQSTKGVQSGICGTLTGIRPLYLETVLQHNLSAERQNWGYTVRSVAMSRDGQRVLSGLASGEIWIWDMSSGQFIYRAQSNTGSMVVRMEISEKHEVVTMNWMHEELRWQLEDEGYLRRVLENEDEQSKLQEGSVFYKFHSVLCRGRIVELGGVGKIATLPHGVFRNAWRYDPQRRVLCAGLWDGRVLLFQVEC